MASAEEGVRLYQLLADRALDALEGVPAAHGTLFRPSASTYGYYQSLYLDQLNTVQEVRRRPGNPDCHYCETFHLGNRKQINKFDDLELSVPLEECFSSFLESQLCGEDQTIVVQR